MKIGRNILNIYLCVSRPLFNKSRHAAEYQSAAENGFPVLRNHDDVMKWKHFPRYWSFVRGIHRLPVNSQHKGQWRGALMFSLICAWINGWVHNRESGDFRRHCAHYEVTVILTSGDYPGCDRHNIKWWKNIVILSIIMNQLFFSKDSLRDSSVTTYCSCSL